MSTEQQATAPVPAQVAAPVIKPGIWDAIHGILGTIITICTSAEKTVKLYERELDNLEVIQLSRIDKSQAERAEALKRT
jgi:hypothetical protein